VNQNGTHRPEVFHNIPDEVHRWALRSLLWLSATWGVLALLCKIGVYFDYISASGRAQFLTLMAVLLGGVGVIVVVGVVSSKTKSDTLEVSSFGIAVNGSSYEWPAIQFVSVEDGILILTDSSGEKPVTYRFSVTCMDHEGIAEAINRFRPAAN